MNYTENYIQEAHSILDGLDCNVIEDMVSLIIQIREQNGRLFFLGVGGSAGNAAHAVNDFRKIAGIESYSPMDNVSELTARINDEGWEGVFVEWLKTSRANEKDGIFILSVGGGNQAKNISVNIVRALEYARKKGVKILGIVGRDGGYTAKVADRCVIIPVVSESSITPHTESFQAVVWHLIVTHPLIMSTYTKWESVR